MNILDVNKAAKANKNRKRVGRGNASGWGTTAGRGHKGAGQKSATSMMKFEGGQMQVFRAIPKRGFNNYRYRTEYIEMNVAELEKIFEAGDTVDAAILMEKGAAKKIENLKILGNGELTKALTVKANAFSKSAAEKIEKAGGKVEKIA